MVCQLLAKLLPDLGNSKDPGKNILRNNAQFDLQQFTNTKLVSVGNQLSASKVKGLVDIDGTPADGGTMMERFPDSQWWVRLVVGKTPRR
jgi:hypothetical protein